MANQDKNSQAQSPFIYYRETGEKIPVSKEVRDAFYADADRIRHKEQHHGRCGCPKQFYWKCDGDCLGCEYHRAGDTLSLDKQNPDGSNFFDFLPSAGESMEEIVAEHTILDELFAYIRDCDPDGDTIVRLWKEHPEGISDRAIARELGRPQMTFADQMKKYRGIMRKLFDD